MGKRRKGREILLQSLYAAAVAECPLPRALHDQLDRREGGDETAAFARALAVKVDAHLAETDRWLAALVEHWDPERLGEVERAILRLALTELRWCPEVPPAVVINEACELARRYASEEAVPFVNGVLDRAARQARGDEPAAAGGAAAAAPAAGAASADGPGAAPAGAASADGPGAAPVPGGERSP